MSIFEAKSNASDSSVEDVSKIPIANIYYLLSYAWDDPELDGLRGVENDDYDGLLEFLTDILVKGSQHLLKRGLDRDYVSQTESMRAIRGKFELTASITSGQLPQGIAICTHDEFTSDILQNQILKSTLIKMSRLSEINAELSSVARSTALRMHSVELIDADARMCGRVKIHRNNRLYGFLLTICRLLLEAVALQENESKLEDAEYAIQDIVRKNIHNIFEVFARNFYRQHLAPSGYKVRSEQIEWNLLAETESAAQFVPRMETDITLEHPERKLIIDTKFYGSGGLTKRTFDQHVTVKFETANMYQLNAYLTHLARQASVAEAAGKPAKHPHDHDAEGMLLYATVDDQDFHHAYQMPPHRFSLATVNLNQPWQNIEARLLSLVL